MNSALKNEWLYGRRFWRLLARSVVVVALAASASALLPSCDAASALPDSSNDNGQAVDRVAEPVITVGESVFRVATSAEFSVTTDNATVYYTLDGTDPSATSNAYSGAPVEIQHSASIRAIATAADMSPSSVAVHEVTRIIDVPSEFGTIQAAINASRAGDVVEIADGTYTGGGNVDLDFGGKPITVRSANGSDRTSIDCAGTWEEPHRAFYFHNGESRDSIVEGLTIVNGYGPPAVFSSDGTYTSSGGGAIYFEFGAAPTIRDCVFTSNTASDGGALYGWDSASPIVERCEFNQNVALNAGGAAKFYNGCDPVISESTFLSNSAGKGGAVDTQMFSNVAFENCLVAENTASTRGGGISSGNSEISIVHTTIVNNEVTSPTDSQGGGLYYWAAFRYPVLQNSIVWGNSALTGDSILFDMANRVDAGLLVTNSIVEGGWDGTAVLDSDPLFVGPAGGDYSLSAGSPAVSAGTEEEPVLTHDIDGRVRPAPSNSSPDIGAYERQ